MKEMLFFAIMSVVYGRHYELTSSFSHSNALFTQGLEYYNGYLYESAGNYGHSTIQIVHPDTGKILLQRKLEDKYFAEGLTVVNDCVYVLTWKEKKMFVFDAHTLQPLGTYTYNTNTGEGWGLTHNNKHLIISDGSDVISIVDFPSENTGTTLRRVRDIRVTEIGQPLSDKPLSGKQYVSRINELEMVNGYIYANIWYVDVILKIDPSDGVISSRYDFRDLFPQRIRPKMADCFNGIAYNQTDDLFTVTGKWWPKYFRVNLK